MGNEEITWSEYDLLLEKHSKGVGGILATLNLTFEDFLFRLSYLKSYCPSPHKTHVVPRRSRFGRVFWKDKDDALIKSIRPLCSLFGMLKEMQTLEGYEEFIKKFHSHEGMYKQLCFTYLLLKQKGFEVLEVEAVVNHEDIDVIAKYKNTEIYFHVKQVEQDDKFRKQFDSLVKINFAIDTLNLRNKSGYFLGVKGITGVVPTETTLHELLKPLVRILKKNGIDPKVKNLVVENDLTHCEDELKPNYPIRLDFVWKPTQGIPKTGELGGLNHTLGYLKQGYLRRIPKQLSVVEISVGIISPYAKFEDANLKLLQDALDASNADGILFLELDTLEGFPPKFVKKYILNRTVGKDCSWLHEIDLCIKF